MDNCFPSFDEALSWSNGISIPNTVGIYATFLNDTANLPDDWLDLLNCEDRLLYIGKSNNLKKRLTTHFRRGTTTDTFRSSIGAILHCSGFLDLGPFIPSPNKPDNYAFSKEHLLSCWIQQNFSFSFLPIDTEADAITKEATLIKNYCPPINVNNNPKKLTKLKYIRAKCIFEAKQNSSQNF